MFTAWTSNRTTMSKRIVSALFAIAMLAGAIPSAADQPNPQGPPDPPDVGEDRWWDGFYAPGLGVEYGWPNHSVAVLEVIDDELVVGGTLRIRANGIIRSAARYDGTTWRALGEGPGGPILAGTKHGEDLVCVVDGDPLRLRRWDGAIWTTLSAFTIADQGAYGPWPRILAMTSAGGEVILAGVFDMVAGTVAENVIAWDGSRWHALGSGLTYPHPWRAYDCVTSLALYEGSLVAGGSFLESDGAEPLRHVARWDGSRWRALGPGLDGAVENLGFQSGLLYATGDFSLDSWEGPQRDRLMRWNGRSWKSVRALLPPNFQVGSIAASSRGLLMNGVTVTDWDPWGDITIGGSFTSQLLVLNGTRWEVLAAEVTNGAVSHTIDYGGHFVAGGRFTGIDVAAGNGLAFLDAAGWHGAVPGRSLEMLDNFLSLDYGSGAQTFLESEGDLLVGGRFVFAGDRRAGGLARWDGTGWSPVGGGTDGDVRALAYWNGLLVVGGGFRHAGAVEAASIATWDGVQWRALGAGFPNGGISAMVDYNGTLIAGGYFNYSGERQVYNVARWDGTLWQPMRFGVWGGVEDLVVYDGDLLAGGNIGWDGRTHVGPVVRWTGEVWETYGSIYGTVNHLRIVDGELYVTGWVRFSEPTSATHHRVARWDGVNWQPVGGRPDLRIQDVVKYNGELVASASYSIDRYSYGRLYRLHDEAWSPLSRQLRTYPRALAVYEGNLYCGGGFRDVGEDRESIGIARWDGATPSLSLESITMPNWTTALEPLGIARAGRPLRIAFRAGASGDARIEVFDVRGRRVRSVAHLRVTPGRYTVDWDLSDDHHAPVARGMYFVRLQLGGEDHVRKVVVASR